MSAKVKPKGDDVEPPASKVVGATEGQGRKEENYQSFTLSTYIVSRILGRLRHIHRGFGLGI